jgi:hypothetical protein
VTKRQVFTLCLLLFSRFAYSFPLDGTNLIHKEKKKKGRKYTGYKEEAKDNINVAIAKASHIEQVKFGSSKSSELHGRILNIQTLILIKW